MFFSKLLLKKEEKATRHLQDPLHPLEMTEASSQGHPLRKGVENVWMLLKCPVLNTPSPGKGACGMSLKQPCRLTVRRHHRCAMLSARFEQPWRAKLPAASPQRRAPRGLPCAAWKTRERKGGEVLPAHFIHCSRCMLLRQDPCCRSRWV